MAAAVVDTVPVGVTVPVRDDVLVLDGVPAGVPVLLPVVDPVFVTAGVRDPDTDADPDPVEDAVCDTAGELVSDAVGEVDAAGVPDTDEVDDGSAPKDREAEGVAEELGVLLAVVDVVDVVEEEAVPVAEDDGVRVPAGVNVAAGVVEAAGEVEATGVGVSPGVTDDAGEVVAAGEGSPEDTTPVVPNTTLSKFTVLVDNKASGLGASLTHNEATLSAAEGRVMTPAEEVLVAKLKALFPNEVAGDTGTIAGRFVNVPVKPVTEYDSKKPVGVALRRHRAVKVMPVNPVDDIHQVTAALAAFQPVV